MVTLAQDRPAAEQHLSVLASSVENRPVRTFLAAIDIEGSIKNPVILSQHVRDVFGLAGSVRQTVVSFDLLQRNNIGATNRIGYASKIVVIVFTDGIVNVV